MEIIDKTPPGEEFDYLRPRGKLLYNIDSVYDAPKIDIIFDDWYVNSVHLWPKDEKVRQHFLMFERTPPVSPQISFSDKSSVDTVF